VSEVRVEVRLEAKQGKRNVRGKTLRVDARKYHVPNAP
jgi:hypothetical protein